MGHRRRSEGFGRIELWLQCLDVKNRLAPRPQVVLLHQVKSRLTAGAAAAAILYQCYR